MAWEVLEEVVRSGIIAGILFMAGNAFFCSSQKMINLEEKNDEEGEDEKDLFEQLPDEILLHIFMKLEHHLKALCLCTAVSKRFASIIHQVDHVFLSASPASPLREADSIKHKPIFSMLRASLLCDVQHLKKFNEIRRVDIEHPYDHGADLLFKWKGVFGDEHIENYVFFSVNSIHKKHQQEQISSYSQEQEEIEASKQESLKMWAGCLRDSLTKNSLSRYIIHELPWLERVTVTDSKKHGTVCLSNENLVEMKNFSQSFPKKVFADLELPDELRRWYVPVLELKSGYVMEGANLVVIGRKDCYADCDFDDGNVIPSDLGVGDEVFREAAKEIMLNHGSKMETIIFGQ